MDAAMTDFAPVSDSAPAEASADAPAQDSAPAAPPAATTAKMIKSLKLKIDNQEFDEALPFEIDESNSEQVEYMRRHLQMSKASGKRMQEAATVRKQAEAFVKALAEDPLKVLSDPRIMGEEKFQALAEQYLSRKLNEQMMTPEQRKAHDNEERLRKYETAEKEQKTQAEAARAKELESHYAQEYQKTIIQALESTSLPKNPYTVRRMAELMQKNLQHGLELEPGHLAQLVKEDYRKELASLMGAADPDQIIAMFGEEMTNKIRKADLAKLKAQQTQVGVASAKRAGSPSAPRDSKPQVSTADWGEYIRKQNGL